jgi:hypothetical protein
MTDSFGFGVLSLQSGIVVAALIVAVLLADRLGGDDGLARKASQIALGLLITLTVFSGTAALIRSPEPPETEGGIFGVGSSEDAQEQEELEAFFKESAERSSEAGTIHIGLGIALVALGGAALRRLRTIPAALLLGGILLVLLGAPPTGGGSSNDTLSLIYAPILGYVNDAGQARDIVRFIVLLVGTVLLLGFIAWRWETPPPAESPTSVPPGPSAACGTR